MKTKIYANMISMALLIFGCGGQCRTSGQNTPKPLAEGKIVSLSFSGNSMIRTGAYSYTLRETGDEVLFDAFYYTGDAPDEIKEINRKSVTVTREDMESLRMMCDKCGFNNKQKTPPRLQTPVEKIIASQLKDAPHVSLTVTWENGAKYRESGITVPCKNELQKIFQELAARVEMNDNDE